MGTLLLLGPALGQAEESLALDQYTLAKGPIVIEGVKANASGLAYHAGRDSLFVVLDQPQRVVEIGFDGSLKRKIDLNKFKDTEGIVWLGDDHFAIVEEVKCNIVIAELEPGDGGSVGRRLKNSSSTSRSTHSTASRVSPTIPWLSGFSPRAKKPPPPFSRCCPHRRTARTNRRPS